MTRITRITGTGFFHKPTRPKAKAEETRASETEKPKLVDPPQRRATDRRLHNRQGPTAPFLAQYVDQHWHWPRDASARVRARQNAASAYSSANTLDTATPSARVLTRKA